MRLKNNLFAYKSKNIACTIVMLFLVLPNLLAQCPPGNIEFIEQEELDIFLIEFPNCEEINGDLTINSGSDQSAAITNLNGLNNISSIAG